MPSGQKLWTREYVMLVAVNFFISLNFHSLMNSMPIFTMDVFGMTSTEAGVVVGLFPAGVLVSRFLAAKTADLIGSKRLLMISLSGMIVLTLAYYFAGSVPVLYTVRIINGFFFGFAANTTLTLAVNIIPRERSGEGIGYYTLGPVLATAVGPFVGVNLAMLGYYKALFVVCAAYSALGAVLVFFVKLSDKPIIEEDELTPREKVRGISQFIELKVLPVGIIAFMLVGTGMGINSFIPPFTKDIDIASIAIYYYPVYAIMMLIVRPFTGKLFDRRGANIVIIPSMIIFALGMANGYFIEYKYQLMITAALVGMGFGSITSSLLATVISIVPIDRVAVANATYFMFVDTTAAIGPMVIGLFIPFVGYRGMFILALIMVGICLPSYYFLHGRKYGSKKRINQLNQ